MGNQCKLIPNAPNGKESILFQEIKRRLNSRDAAKRIWGFTQTDLFKSEFSDLEKDENGEPTYDAIAEVLGLDALMNGIEKDNSLAVSMGLMDSSGKSKSFETAGAALTKANEFNNNSSRKIAVVSKDENGNYNAGVTDRTPIAIAEADRNEQRAKLNSALISLLHRCGFDVSFENDVKYRGVFDPLNAEQNADNLRTVIRVANNEEGREALPEEVAHLILAGMKDHSLKQRIDAAFTDEVVRRVLGDEYNQYVQKYKNLSVPLREMLREEAEGKLFADILKGNQTNYATTEKETITISRNEYTDEFRRLQKRSNQLSGSEIRAFHRGESKLTQREQANLAAVYERLIAGGMRGRDSVWTDLTAGNNVFRLVRVNEELFSDIFAINHNYLPKGELVDHPNQKNYNGSKCFLTNDGLSGFAIEPDGNLVSVFNLNPAKDPNKAGFLMAIGNFAKEQGATHLDAYSSNTEKHTLEQLYGLFLDFKTASRMDYNMEYDHDDIAANHGNPDVVFMVNNPNEIEERHFDENSYDDAVNYQKQNIRKEAKRSLPKPLFERSWNWAKDKFSKLSEEEVDAAVINARNALQPISELVKSGEVQRILDREQIMAHQKMYALSDKMERTANIMQEGETLLSKRLYILQHTQTEQDTATLRKTVNKVRRDLENQQYAVACYRILAEIGSDVKQLMKECDDIGFVFNNTTNLNVISSEAGLVNRMKVAVQAYMPYLETLRDLPRMVKKGEIDMHADFAAQMSKEANAMLEQLSVLQKDVRQMRFSVLKQLISLYHGDYGNKPDSFKESERAKWESVDMILSRASQDISSWDTFLFSAGDSRNPLINVVHKIVVTQQAKRDNKINKACMKLQEAEAKLHKAGYDNKFVYRFDINGKPTGYYAGPVNFELYEQQRKEFIESIDYDNTDYYEVQRLINKWEEDHLEEVQVGKPIDGHYRMEFHPKKSIYGVKDFQKGWSKEQKDYYDALMDMKAEMDSYLPVSMQCLYAAPQVRKSVTQMFDKDGRGALKTIYGKWRSEFSIVDDNVDYNKNLEYVDKDGKKQILLDFEGKPIKRVPIYFINQLEDMEDLSTDATHAMFNYIAMSINYSEMGQLAQAMRLLQDHVNEDYEVVQTDAGKPLVDMFKSLGRKYEREYVKTGSDTKVAKALTEYIDRQFFNDTKQVIGNAPNPFNEDKPVSIDSLYNILLKITSISRMGLNILSGITNVTQGESQMVCEAMAGRYFNGKDLIWSKKEYNKLLPKYMANFNSADRHDRMYLLINQFNSSEDFFRDMRDKDFNKSSLKRVLGRGNIYFLNTAGEHYLHTSGMLNILKHEKVKRTSDPSKEVSLYDVIKEVHDENGWHLELDSDIEFVDKNKSFLQSFGDKNIITRQDRDKLFENLSVYIQKINADMHGGYSEAEKGNANRQVLWRLALQFRQWMFGMYNKAYAREYYDAVTGTMREGGYVTIFKFLTGTIHDLKNMSIKMAIENNRMTEEEKQNAKVAYTQAFTFVALCLIAAITKGWKDKDDMALRLLAYQTRRLQMETGALVPYPFTFFKNVFTLIQSPAAGIKTLENLSQLFDLATFFTEIQSGRFKGWWRGMKALWTATPLYNIQKLIDMDDYNYMFNIFS